MKTKIVLCPTLKYAFYEWHRLADTYSDMWVNVCRKPMSLTSRMGVKYIFLSENETDKLKGFHGDFIRWDEVEPQEREKKMEDNVFEKLTAEEQDRLWMYMIFNQDKIIEKTEEWTKEAEKASMSLTEYLESISPLNNKEKTSWLGKNCKDCGNEKCKKLGTLPQGYDCALWQAERSEE